MKPTDNQINLQEAAPMRFVITGMILALAGSLQPALSVADDDPTQVIRGVQVDRGALNADRGVRRDVVDVTEDLAPPPLDGCGNVAYQIIPSPVDDVNVEVLEQAGATLDVALDILMIELPERDSTIEEDLLYKSQLLTRLLAGVCRSGGCRREGRNE